MFFTQSKKISQIFQTLRKLWFCAILSEILQKMSCKLQYLAIGASKTRHKMITFSDKCSKHIIKCYVEIWNFDTSHLKSQVKTRNANTFQTKSQAIRHLRIAPQALRFTPYCRIFRKIDIVIYSMLHSRLSKHTIKLQCLSTNLQNTPQNDKLESQISPPLM